MESREESSSLHRGVSERVTHGCDSSSHPSNALDMRMSTPEPQPREAVKRRSLTGMLHFLRSRTAPIRRRSTVTASLVVKPQLKMQRTQTLTRSLTSLRPSLGVALTLANARTTQEQDEQEMKTAAYELMMQHFQLRKVDGPATEAKSLWDNDVNPSTASYSSNSPTALRRKTTTDFSRRWRRHILASWTKRRANSEPRILNLGASEGAQIARLALFMAPLWQETEAKTASTAAEPDEKGADAVFARGHHR